MNTFSAEASLYRTSNLYLSSFSECKQSSFESIYPAYYPGPETKAGCYDCTSTCVKQLAWSSGMIAAGVAVGCATIVGCPFAVSAGASALVLANEVFAGCMVYCELPEINIPFLDWKIGGDCCPKLCGIPNPLDPGSGCCDHGENCVDQNDPNSRDGCCPSNQSVCGGKCCPANFSCCGDTCCPPNYYCRDGGFCSEYPSDLIPRGWKPSPKPPNSDSGCYLFEGGSPCGNKCCYGGLQCCGVDINGQPICKTSCLH